MCLAGMLPKKAKGSDDEVNVESPRSNIDCLIRNARVTRPVLLLGHDTSASSRFDACQRSRGNAVRRFDSGIAEHTCQLVALHMKLTALERFRGGPVGLDAANTNTRSVRAGSRLRGLCRSRGVPQGRIYADDRSSRFPVCLPILASSTYRSMLP